MRSLRLLLGTIWRWIQIFRRPARRYHIQSEGHPESAHTLQTALSDRSKSISAFPQVDPTLRDGVTPEGRSNIVTNRDSFGIKTAESGRAGSESTKIRQRPQLSRANAETPIWRGRR